MPIEAGTRLGPYEITAPIGAGGMGEVYKATDTRLDRTVAIKVLPSELAADPERRERFEREAKAVAALSHPHICPVFDVGQQDGIDFLVMEHLEGETLADRLTKGALPLDQALRYAIEIADALDKAHRQGIVHRDLKPGNIMLTKAGAKLLDFGLAKLREPAVTGDLTALPTRSENLSLTGEGKILGTLQYMAPEQLEGQRADARTDIFAFGAVVYEMVTGQKAFEGKSRLSVMTAILERDPPPISTLQPMTLPTLDHVVKRSLAKDPDDRWQTARDLHQELTWVAEGGSHVDTVATAQPQGWRQALPLALAASLVVGTLTGLAVWSVMRSGESMPRTVKRFPLTLPSTQQFTGRRHVVALSPDGTHLAYTANNQLYIRAMDQLDATPLPGIDDPVQPIFSPDSQWIAFHADRRLQKIGIRGGVPVTLCEVGTGIRGMSWSADDTIVFGQGPEGIFRVPGVGGPPARLIAGEESQLATSPQVLPDGQVLFTLQPAGGGRPDEMQVVVESLATGERRVVIDGGSGARYLPTGHVVYARGETLLAVPFDLARLEVTGNSVPLVEAVAPSPFGSMQVGISEHGSLVYVPAASLVGAAPRRLVWVDRTGHAEPQPDERRYRSRLPGGRWSDRPSTCRPS